MDDSGFVEQKWLVEIVVETTKSFQYMLIIAFVPSLSILQYDSF